MTFPCSGPYAGAVVTFGTRHGKERPAAEPFADALRLARGCPACTGPGWGPDGAEPGLPCRACALPTDGPEAERWSCPGCRHTERRALAGTADPRWCPGCNP